MPNTAREKIITSEALYASVPVKKVKKVKKKRLADFANYPSAVAVYSNTRKKENDKESKMIKNIIQKNEKMNLR